MMTSLNFVLTNQKNSFESKSVASYLCDLAPSGDRGIELSFRTPSEKGSIYRSIFYLYPDCSLRRDRSPSQHQVSLKKFASSLSTMIRALGSPLAPRLKRDLATDLYSASTPLACYDESKQWISFNRLNKSAISLSVAIEASGSPLGPRPKRDLASDLYSDSTPIAIKDESNRQISFR
jgi:hypothetical protein